MAIEDEYRRALERFKGVSDLARVANEISAAARMTRMSSTFYKMRDLLQAVSQPNLVSPSLSIPADVLSSVREQLDVGRTLALSEEVRRSLLESVTVQAKTLQDLQVPSAFASLQRLTATVPPEVFQSLHSPAWERALEQVRTSTLDLSDDAADALSRGLRPLLSDGRDDDWDEEEGPLLLAELAEVVEAATPALTAELADAQTPEDRVHAFVGWWRDLPPLVQLVFALLLQWATLGLSAEYLKNRGMLPGLEVKDEE